MEEVHINSSDLAADHKSAVSVQAATILQKIYRKGDKIYHANDENLTMIKEVNDQTKTENNLTDAQVDQVSSGESLYKTFSFDNNISKEETEKCISFWRSVVEKNLEPIKCTIIENINNPKRPNNDAEKKDKQKEKKHTKKADKQVPKEIPKRELRNSVWFHILEELQKIRLNKTKLSQSKFLTAEDVPSTSFPMRQIAAKETRSKQGFIRD